MEKASGGEGRLILKNGSVLLPDEEEPKKFDIEIHGEKIIRIGRDLEEDDDTVDASGHFVLPGGIDPHVHFDDPGFTHREDFYHGTCAAASGGITTVIDMPCTSIPPVTNLENLKQKLSVIEKKAVVDYGLYGGVSCESFEEGFSRYMEELSTRVMGFKTYFISGMESFGRLNHYQFKTVLEKAVELGVPVLLHAEDYDYVTAATSIVEREGNTPRHYYLSRPETAEHIAAAAAAEIAAEVGADLHIVHVSSAATIEILKTKGVTAETAPHYLEFDIEDFEKTGSALKTTPPVKSPPNKHDLWRLLSDGRIRFVASDHAPCPEDEKQTGSVWTDYAGIPGTGTLFPYMFSEGYVKKRISLRRFVEAVSENAAKRYGLFHRKGSIVPGKDADFVLIDPGESCRVEGKKFYSKGKITPFETMRLKGKIVKTILRGKVIFDCDRGICAEPGEGKLLERNR
ncbi:MAG TPA: allantoinase AllB [Spirochaetota bacterium]|nr:allantoinase AllB [Spirochaetota bacterium]